MQAPAMRRETVRSLVQVHLGFALTEADLGRLMPRVAQLVEASRQLYELELGESTLAASTTSTIAGCRR